MAEGELRARFPDGGDAFDEDVLSAVLELHGNDVDAAAAFLREQNTANREQEIARPDPEEEPFGGEGEFQGDVIRAESGWRQTQCMSGHSDWALGVTFLPEFSTYARAESNHLLISGAIDESLILWDPDKGELLARGLHIHGDWIRNVSAMRDGLHVLSAGDDGFAHKVSVEHLAGHRMKSIVGSVNAHAGYCYDAKALGSSGDLIVAAYADRLLCTWDLRSNAKTVMFNGHTEKIVSVSSNLDGTKIVSGSYDDTAIVFDVRKSEPLFELKDAGGGQDINCVEMCPDDLSFITAGDEGIVKKWDLLDPLSSPVSRYPNIKSDNLSGVRGVCAVAEFLAAGSSSGVRVFNSFDLEDLERLDSSLEDTVKSDGPRVNAGNVKGLSSSEDGSRLASCADDGRVRVWERSNFPRTKGANKR